MPRKRIIGRARVITKENALDITIDRVNRKLKRLYRAGLDNKYAASKLKSALKVQGDFRIEKGRLKGSPRNLTISQVRYYKKVFSSFINSPVSSPIGIERSRVKSKESLKQSLGELSDSREISDQDVDDFYSLFKDEDYTYFSDKIGVSAMYALSNEAQARNYSEDKFIDVLGTMVTLSVKEVRDKARRVYEKYVS